ncbi:DUF1353 domain-containing protein [Pseudoxanthomonas mexicana]|uniref:DUF1353 domain-containing protein n=1 Tax=Pseudoxanthomonas mexicana TaxID=128785 RepID=UPI00387E4C4D
MYFTTGPIGWGPNPGQKGPPPVSVPVGFVTDLASIPRVFWSILPTNGRYAHSAVVHDYLYWEQSLSREESDEVMALSMADFDISKSTIKAIRTAVRSPGGQRAWDKNARLKALGEKRVLRRFPNTPTVTWDAWKRQPGVFR